ncbi:hypothetical protein GCM10023336_37200 [Streptomyces similanensis]|uniref:Uncharacterized protein n=1 Tax=Streptomyces similanensis TaxID=1274988 RepID=A0ABP9KKG6_9ACTN
MQGALTTLAHEGTTNSGWATHKRMMESGEAAAWVPSASAREAASDTACAGSACPSFPWPTDPPQPA